jgi:ribonuclease HI
VIEVYTDGSCNNNPKAKRLPKVGGIGIVVIEKDGTVTEGYNGPYPNTTSARMELQAIITALSIIPSNNIKLYTDYEGCVKAFNEGWLINWMENGIEDRTNSDLWKKLTDSYLKHKSVEFIHVNSHVGIEFNELADKLAKKGRES